MLPLLIENTIVCSVNKEISNYLLLLQNKQTMKLWLLPISFIFWKKSSRKLITLFLNNYTGKVKKNNQRMKRCDLCISLMLPNAAWTVLSFVFSSSFNIFFVSAPFFHRHLFTISVVITISKLNLFKRFDEMLLCHLNLVYFWNWRTFERIYK